MKRVLIIGCGSVGQRHISALNKLSKVEVAALRTRKGSLVNLPSHIKNVLEFDRWSEALHWRPTHAVISNPTILHVPALEACCNAGINHLLIEKPLAASARQVKQVKDLFRKYRGRWIIGFNLRFHPVFQFLKKTIESKSYGRPIRAVLNVGHYLPFWHSWEDYSNSYCARKDLGGGVLRTLSHEIDMAQFLFGPIKSVYARVGRMSDLKINVDDNAQILAQTDRDVAVDLSMDFLRPLPQRFGEIFLSKGMLRYDIHSGTVEWCSYKKKILETVFKANNFDIQKTYDQQMESFISSADVKLCGLEDGLRVMKIIEAAEYSSRKGEKEYVAAR